MLLWYFWLYSFLGFLLERAFAAATRAEHQARRCFLLLPLCPVYGLGMLAVLALPRELPFWALALWGGLGTADGSRCPVGPALGGGPGGARPAGRDLGVPSGVQR